MAQKDLHHRITGDSTSLTRATDEGSRALSKMEREARRLEAQQRKLHAGMATAGRGMFLAGAAIAAGLALSVRAAIEWESAWAGVLKTVEGSPEQMAALEEEIRALTGVLPATHAEIAAVAEAAGQLGVQRENVAAFTKTMIDMGEATNLSSDEAATAIARFMNIMQTAPGDVSRLASAIVDLGNKGATTESEITEMALRIAGAGNTIGLSEQQVLGFAAALSNVGIRAEAGGTAISRVFLEIDAAVSQGGDNLATFARTAGMSADQFAAAYERDAGQAIAAFIAGLGQAQAAGGDMNAILAQLGLTEIRVSDALRRLAGSGGNLAVALQTGSDAWEQNNALTEEAERRYETTAAKLAIARNQLNDFAIDLGGTLLPAVANVAEAVGGLVRFLDGLPGPVKQALGVVAALSAAWLLFGGALLMVIPRIAATQAALATMTATAAVSGGAMGRMATGIRGMVLWAGRATGALIGLQVAATILRTAIGGNLNPQVDALGEGLARWAETGQASGETARLLGEDMGKLDTAFRSFNSSGFEQGLAGVIETLSGTEGVDDSMHMAADRIKAVDEALTQLVQSGRGDEAAEIFARVADMAAEHGHSMEDLNQLMPSYAAALEVAAAAGDGVAASGDAAAEGVTGVGDAAAEATAAVDTLADSLDSLFTSLFGVEEAEDAAAEAMRNLRGEAENGATAWKGNSEEALRNRDNIRSLIEADYDIITAMAEAGATSGDLTERTEQLRRAFVRQMRQAGFSEEAIEAYAASYDPVPSLVSTTIDTPGLVAARGRLAALKTQLDNIDRFVQINIAVNGPAPGVGGLRGAFQHGGEVVGPSGIDRVPIRATAGEIVIRREVAQRNRAALLALNETGRLPVGTSAGGGGSGGAPTAMSTVSELDRHVLARAVAQEVGRAIDGAHLVIDDRGMGRLVAKRADYYRRGG